jgi:hypothetical protein
MRPPPKCFLSQKNVAETHEALSTVQMLTNSKEKFLLVNDSEKKIL